MKTSTPANDLRTALERLGAREFEMVALSMDPHRGLAALAFAQEKGVDRPIPYAISIFDNPEWQPRGEKKTPLVNAAVAVSCAMCGGDRFVVHTTRLPQQTGWMAAKGITPNAFPIEEMKPCPSCNSSVDAGFWKANGERFEVAK